MYQRDPSTGEFSLKFLMERVRDLEAQVAGLQRQTSGLFSTNFDNVMVVVLMSDIEPNRGGEAQASTALDRKNWGRARRIMYRGTVGDNYSDNVGKPNFRGIDGRDVDVVNLYNRRLWAGENWVVFREGSGAWVPIVPLGNIQDIYGGSGYTPIRAGNRDEQSIIAITTDVITPATTDIANSDGTLTLGWGWVRRYTIDTVPVSGSGNHYDITMIPHNSGDPLNIYRQVVYNMSPNQIDSGKLVQCKLIENRYFIDVELCG